MSHIPVLICVDVEPDERQPTLHQDDWRGFEHTLTHFALLRAELEAATNCPVAFNWFLRMDEQIKHIFGRHSWVVQRYGNAFRRLERVGDEIGLHIHSWRPGNPQRTWVADYSDSCWLEKCAEDSLEAFENAFGRRCESFRFGDHWMNSAMMSYLESRGIKFDLTVEPGIETAPCYLKDSMSSFPDYSSALRRPYHPASDDFRRSALHETPLWEIPISTGRAYGRFATLKQMLKIVRPQGFALNLGLYEGNFRAVVQQNLERSEHLAIVIRSDACLPSRLLGNVQRNIRFLVSHPLIKNFRFVTPAQAIAMLFGRSPEVDLPASVAAQA